MINDNMFQEEKRENPTAKLNVKFVNEKNESYHMFVEVTNLESLELAQSALNLLKKQYNYDKPKSMIERLQQSNR